MKRKLIENFIKISENKCIDTLTDEEIGIYDCSKEHFCKIEIPVGDLSQFTVFNPKKKEISFFKIDKCLFSDKDKVERCDFALFNNSVFCFIELKGSFDRRKAKDQLLSTITYFKEKIIFKIRVEAYACLGNKTEAKPATKARDLADMSEFLELNVVLLFGNSRKF